MHSIQESFHLQVFPFLCKNQKFGKEVVQHDHYNLQHQLDQHGTCQDKGEQGNLQASHPQAVDQQPQARFFHKKGEGPRPKKGGDLLFQHVPFPAFAVEYKQFIGHIGKQNRQHRCNYIGNKILLLPQQRIHGGKQYQIDQRGGHPKN